MSDDQASQGVQQQAKGNIAPRQNIDASSCPDNPGGTAPQPVGNHTEIENLTDRVKRAEWMMIGLTGAIAFFALCQVVVGCLQWDAMAGQLAEMRKSGDQAERQIILNQGQLVQTAKAAGAASNAVKQAEAALHLDQRAWVAPDSFGAIIEAGKPLETMVMFKNTGKTPAINLHGTTVHEGVAHGKTPDFNYAEKGLKHFNIGMLAPNGEMTADIQFHRPGEEEPMILTQVIVDGIVRGDVVVYVHGRLAYKDIFAKSHWMTYCSLYNPKTRKFGSCKEHNDTDHR